MLHPFKAAIMWTDRLGVTPFIFPHAGFSRIRDYGTFGCLTDRTFQLQSLLRSEFRFLDTSADISRWHGSDDSVVLH